MKFFKELKWHAILKGIMYILIGVVAFILPETMVKTLGYLIGIVLIAIGVVSMISYLLRDARQNYYHDDFVYGLGAVLIGIVMLFKVELIISLIPLLLGVMVLLSGFSKLQDVIDMKRLGYDSWVFMMILAIINIALGAVLIANPFDAVTLFFRVMGAGLIFSGVTDCVSVAFFAAKFKKIHNAPDVEISGEYEEITESSGGEGEETR